MWIIISIVALYALYQLIELNRFSVKNVHFEHSDIKGNYVFLSDIHGKTYGDPEKNKSRLVRKIMQLHPEAIIIGGDTVSKEQPKQYPKMIALIKQLQEIAPVYYLFGNHETSLEKNDKIRFKDYMDELNAIGVHICRNEVFYPCIQKEISCFALELPLKQYKKFTKVPLEEGILQEVTHKWTSKDNELRFLFVHQPAYAKEFVRLKVDGIFSGHTHGGLVRIPGVGGVLSPELTFFPKLDGGIYQVGEDEPTTLVVSRGLGTHHFNIRVFDTAQVIYVTISSCKPQEN